MILYYTESELIGYDSIYLYNYRDYDYYTAFGMTNTPIDTQELARFYNSPLVEFGHKLSSMKIRTYFTEVNIRALISLATKGPLMAWILIEQISPNSYVRLSGIKIKDSPDICPLKIDVYDKYFCRNIGYSGYCYTMAEICKLDNQTQGHKKDIRWVYIDKIKRITHEIYKICNFNTGEYLPELIQHIDTQVVDNIALYGDGVVSEHLYNLTRDLILDTTNFPIPSGEEILYNMHSRNIKEVIDIMLKPIYITTPGDSKLFNYVKNGIIKLDMREIVPPDVELITPYQFKTGEFDYIEGDYLLTPNICSSINNFNLSKYGNIFVNLNLLHTRDIRQLELMLKIDSIFSDILVINEYVNNRDDLTHNLKMKALCHALNGWGDIFPDYIQITKTFMGDVVVTMFDESKRLVSALYYNSIIEVLNRPTLVTSIP